MSRLSPALLPKGLQVLRFSDSLRTGRSASSTAPALPARSPHLARIPAASPLTADDAGHLRRKDFRVGVFSHSSVPDFRRLKPEAHASAVLGSALSAVIPYTALPAKYGLSPQVWIFSY